MSDLHMFAIVTGVSEYHVAGLVGAATSPTVDLPGITSSSASLSPVSSLQYSLHLRQISPSLSLALCLFLGMLLSLLALDMHFFSFSGFFSHKLRSFGFGRTGSEMFEFGILRNQSTDLNNLL